MMLKKTCLSVLVCSTLLATTGCSAVAKRVGNSFSTSLNEAVMNHNDLQLVADGAPAYMLLADSFLQRGANDPTSYNGAAGLYSAYAGVFVDDKERALKLSDRAFQYAKTGLCLDAKELCDIEDTQFDVFEVAVTGTRKSDLPSLFTTASVWAGWVQLRKDDWGAIAALPKIKKLVDRVLELDPSYRNGQAQMYMGVLESLIPPAAGGDLEKAKMHFEKAREISDGRNLFVNVLLAENYARMIFDQEIHDRLLEDVIAADPEAEGFTLMNVVAQKEAKKLLASSDEYFN